MGSASSKKCWFDKYNFSSIIYRFGKFNSLENHCPLLRLYIFIRIFLELAHSIFNGLLSSPLMKMRMLKILLPILFLPGGFLVLSRSWYYKKKSTFAVFRQQNSLLQNLRWACLKISVTQLPCERYLNESVLQTIWPCCTCMRVWYWEGAICSLVQKDCQVNFTPCRYR